MDGTHPEICSFSNFAIASCDEPLTLACCLYHASYGPHDIFECGACPAAATASLAARWPIKSRAVELRQTSVILIFDVGHM